MAVGAGGTEAGDLLPGPAPHVNVGRRAEDGRVRHIEALTRPARGNRGTRPSVGVADDSLFGEARRTPVDVQAGHNRLTRSPGSAHRDRRATPPVELCRLVRLVAHSPPRNVVRLGVTVLGPEVRPLARPDGSSHIGDEVRRLAGRARTEVDGYYPDGVCTAQELPELVRPDGRRAGTAGRAVRVRCALRLGAYRPFPVERVGRNTAGIAERARLDCPVELVHEVWIELTRGRVEATHAIEFPLVHLAERGFADRADGAPGVDRYHTRVCSGHTGLCGGPIFGLRSRA